ncbi:hypothetical protein SLA2020_336340 [Shorea laevis]
MRDDKDTEQQLENGNRPLSWEDKILRSKAIFFRAANETGCVEARLQGVRRNAVRNHVVGPKNDIHGSVTMSTVQIVYQSSCFFDRRTQQCQRRLGGQNKQGDF